METKLIFDATKPMPPYDFPKEAQAPDEVLKKSTSRGIRALTSRARTTRRSREVMIDWFKTFKQFKPFQSS